MLGAKQERLYNAWHEQAPARQARPNSFHAVRGIVDAVDFSRGGCVNQHGIGAAGGRRQGVRGAP